MICYCLPASALDNLAKLTSASLQAICLQDEEVTPFTVLDCFDQSLRRSKRLLLQSPGKLELLDEQDGLIEQAADSKARFVSDLAKGPVKRALSNVSPLRSLLPIGSGSRLQITLSLVDDDGKTHCRAHISEFSTAEGRSIVFARLQAIRGYDNSLELLQRHLTVLGGVKVGYHDLYEALFPELEVYDPKPDIPIAEDDTAFTAANRIIATHLPILRANEAGIIADYDTEFLHDYRIQLRKIRSVLSLFKGVYDADQTAEMKARFSALAAVTGALRDLDVYLLDKPHFYRLVPESLHGGLDALFQTLTRQRTAARNQLIRHLRSPDYEREITDLIQRFTESGGMRPGVNAAFLARDFACDRIWQRYRKVRKIACRIDENTPDEDVHELRIHFKRLRYLVEFFSPMFPAKELNRLLKPMKRVQDNLGLFNDYSVQQEKLRALLDTPRRKTTNAAGIEMAQSVGALIAVLHTRQLEERAKVMKNFARFDEPKIRKTFSRLFQQQQRKEDT